MADIVTPFQLTDNFDMTEFNNRIVEINGITSSKIPVSSAVQTLTGASDVDGALRSLPSFNLASYMQFVAKVNVETIDCAFGKNNTIIVGNIGTQLAMYGWFKGDSPTTFPFTVLKTCNTFDEVIGNPLALKEAFSSSYIAELILYSDYARTKLYDSLPTVPLFTAMTSNTTPTTSTGTVSTYSGEFSEGEAKAFQMFDGNEETYVTVPIGAGKTVKVRYLFKPNIYVIGTVSYKLKAEVDAYRDIGGVFRFLSNNTMQDFVEFYKTRMPSYDLELLSSGSSANSFYEFQIYGKYLEV